MDLTILIPCKNDKSNLNFLIDEIKKNYPDISILIVTSKSDDIDYKIIEKYSNISQISQKTKGYGAALIEGILHVKTKFFIIHNADGSFEVSKIAEMYDLSKSYDFVFCDRYIDKGGSEDDTIITFIGNKFFSKLGNLLFSLKISDILYTYIMGKTSSHKSLNILSNDFRYCVELPIKMQLAKMKYQCFPSYEKKRIAGKKKVNAFKDGFLILTEMFRLFFKFKVFGN